MKIDLYSQDGTKKGEIEVSDKIFNAKVNHTLIHRALVRQLSNRRKPVAHVKTKGEVRGGGKKPWRQKHTGRARQGSTRNPHFRGGGVVFGPRNVRNFELDMPKQERRQALYSALSAKAKENLITALEKYEIKGEKSKTKDFAAMIKKLKFEKDMLFVLPEKNEMIERACRNIPIVKPLLVQYLNIDDLLRFKNILFLKDALVKLESSL